MNHERTADDYIFIVTHAQFIHYFVEANIIGARCRTRYRRRKATLERRDATVSETRQKSVCVQKLVFFLEIYWSSSENHFINI